MYVLLVGISRLLIYILDVLSSKGMSCSFTEKSEAVEDGAGISGMYALFICALNSIAVFCLIEIFEI